MAADYLARYFNGIGLKPLGYAGSYFQGFSFVSGTNTVPHKNYLQIVRDGNAKDAASFDAENDFLPLSFTTNGEVEGQVVFAGYGLVVPGENGYNSYAGLDVKARSLWRSTTSLKRLMRKDSMNLPCTPVCVIRPCRRGNGGKGVIGDDWAEVLNRAGETCSRRK